MARSALAIAAQNAETAKRWRVRMTSARLSSALSERAGDEAELHGEREPRRRGGVELPLRGDLRRHRGDAEPEPHGEELDQGQEDECAHGAR